MRRRRNEPGRRHSRRRRRNEPGARHYRRRRNPGGTLKGFMSEAPRAIFADGLAITVGKAGARGLPGLVGIKPTGMLGLAVQLLTGVVIAGGVHVLGFRGFAVNMLRGTGENLYESLARTPVAGKPIPFIGTALSDYSEAYRLAGAPRAAATTRPVGAYARPVAISRGMPTRSMGRYAGRVMGSQQQQQGA